MWNISLELDSLNFSFLNQCTDALVKIKQDMAKMATKYTKLGALWKRCECYKYFFFSYIQKYYFTLIGQLFLVSCLPVYTALYLQCGVNNIVLITVKCTDLLLLQ